MYCFHRRMIENFEFKILHTCIQNLALDSRQETDVRNANCYESYVCKISL